MTILQDVRYGVRVLLKSSGTTLVMLLILGLGIGANTAIFTLVNALYLKPLPLRQPDEVVRIFAKGRYAYGAGFSYPEYIALRDHTTSFSALAAETTRRLAPRSGLCARHRSPPSAKSADSPRVAAD